eukprot:Amastigsp_a7037_15.p5 type:complete len:103 gc:universal Amastigsp_a7037_15:1229-921(-)
MSSPVTTTSGAHGSVSGNGFSVISSRARIASRTPATGIASRPGSGRIESAFASRRIEAMFKSRRRTRSAALSSPLLFRSSFHSRTNRGSRPGACAMAQCRCA